MDVDEFQSVVVPLSRRLWAVAMRMLRSDDDARDAVQDALARLWDTRHRLKSVASIEAYCISAVRNAALDRLRRLEHCSDSPPPDPAAEPAHDPLQRIDDSSELQRLQQLMKQLSADQQRAIELSAYGGLSNDEIADATGWSPANVRALLSRGRRKLKELYKSSRS
jgi:RNA polymerase sigma-70 factor (ECF subfamily)